MTDGEAVCCIVCWCDGLVVGFIIGLIRFEGRKPTATTCYSQSGYQPAPFRKPSAPPQGGSGFCYPHPQAYPDDRWEG